MAMFSALYTFDNTVFKTWVVINNAYYVKKKLTSDLSKQIKNM